MRRVQASNGVVLETISEPFRPPGVDEFCGTTGGHKPTATARGSSANVCHNAPTTPGIYRANPRSAPPPTASACDPSSGRMACSPRRYGGCAACDPPWSPPAVRLGCHSPCPGTDSAAAPRSARAVRSPPPRWSPPAVCSLGRWLRRGRPPAARLAPRPAG